MSQEHPITPPPELIEKWRQDTLPGYRIGGLNDIVTQAARWGADQELKACYAWVSNELNMPGSAICLREDRRSKPPSLKEQALEVLNEIESGKHGWLRIFDNLTTIRRALESLPEEQ